MQKKIKAGIMRQEHGNQPSNKTLYNEVRRILKRFTRPERKSDWESLIDDVVMQSERTLRVGNAAEWFASDTEQFVCRRV